MTKKMLVKTESVDMTWEEFPGEARRMGAKKST